MCPLHGVKWLIACLSVSDDVIIESFVTSNSMQTSSSLTGGMTFTNVCMTCLLHSRTLMTYPDGRMFTAFSPSFIQY